MLDEKWIKVVRPDAVTEEVSLTDVLLCAHEYVDLAGELPTQDVAVLRLLLAVLHTVFSRVNIHGQEEALNTPQDALRRWSSLWRLGHFPEEPVRAYLETWHERFWLFHPTRPFYQVNEAAVGTESQACKLNGEMSQSNNKERLFPMRSGEQKESMGYAEAARWLLYVNAYDDTSAKPKGKDLPTPGIGWLGKLGLITAEGRTLFETLMLNVVLLPDGHLWEEREKPCWELAIPRTGERMQISLPHNAAELLTLQSRRILLRRDGNRVMGYTLLGGDFFSRENSTVEQMTVWGSVRDKNGNVQYLQPKRHNMTRQMWRDFGAITAIKEGNMIPGVVRWTGLLRKGKMLPGKQISFRIASVQYGDKDFFISHVFDDHLTFHTELLTEAGAVGYSYAIKEIESIEKAAGYIDWLATDLSLAAGNRGNSGSDRMKARYFDLVDAPFRRWLATLDPEEGAESLLKHQAEWREEARRLAIHLCDEMIERAGKVAFKGREVTIKEKKSEVKRFYSSPKAANKFKWRIYKLYPIEKEMGDEG